MIEPLQDISRAAIVSASLTDVLALVLEQRNKLNEVIAEVNALQRIKINKPNPKLDKES